MIINKFLNEMKIVESTSDFLTIQQSITDMFKHNNPRNIVIKLFNNYKDFVDLVKGKDQEVEVEKKKEEVKPSFGKKKEELPPEETATGKVMAKVKSKEEKPVLAKKEAEKPNLEGAVATLLKRTTGEDIELDLDKYYTVSGRKKSDILSDNKLLKTIQDIKDASLTDEKRLLMPLFQVNIKLDEYLSNKRHMLTVAEKQKIVLAVFWILLIDNKYIPSDEKLDDLFQKYGQSKNFKAVKAKIKLAKKKSDKELEKEK